MEASISPSHSFLDDKFSYSKPALDAFLLPVRLNVLEPVYPKDFVPASALDARMRSNLCVYTT